MYHFTSVYIEIFRVILDAKPGNSARGIGMHNYFTIIFFIISF